MELAQLQESSSVLLTKLSTLFHENLNNKKASQLYQKLAEFNSDMSTKTLKIGASLNEFLNKEMKYQAKVEPIAFRLYFDLVKTTDTIFQKQN